jgi:hypothetical protein
MVILTLCGRSIRAQDEDSEVRKARFALLLAITKEIFKARDRIKLMMHTLKLTDTEEKENG